MSAANDRLSGPDDSLAARKEEVTGLLAALSAYVIWGLSSIYWAQLSHVNPFEIVSHRAIWTAVLMLPVLWMTGRIPGMMQAFRQPRLVLLMLLAAALVQGNWGIFVWSVGHGHAQDASLGYFVLPLFSVALSTIILRENLRPGQWLAVGLIIIAVGQEIISLGRLPWVTISLAMLFAGYGLLRKQAPVDAMTGLTMETLLGFPLFFGLMVFWEFDGSAALFNVDLATDLLLIGAGPVTASALWLYIEGAKRLPLSRISMLFYLNPVIQFLIAVFLFQEDLPPARVATFGLIWLALAVYGLEGWRHRQRRKAAHA